MHKITLFILAAVFAVALAEGQYYVPRAYYTIDAEGHESARVPLRRLRRSIQPYPHGGGDANAHAEATSYGGNAEANAHAINYGPGNGGGWPYNGDGRSNNGNWGSPGNSYGSSKPVGPGQTRRMFGAVQGNSVSASTVVGVGPDGNGFYDETASTH